MRRLPGTLTDTIIITITAVQMPATICGIHLIIIRPIIIRVRPVMSVHLHHRVEAAAHLRVQGVVRL